MAKRRTCHRFWAPVRRRALRLPTKQLHHSCSLLAAPRNVAQPCKASSSLALRACGKAASQFATRRAKAQRLPQFATLRRLQSTSFMANHGQRVLPGKHKQCSIRSCHCLPTPRMRCLTIRSTGHFAACGNWASFHSRPTAACHKMPVSSNVRQRQCKPFNHCDALP